MHRRRGRPRTRRPADDIPAPGEEQIAESVHAPSQANPSGTSQSVQPPQAAAPAGVQVDMAQMAQMLAAAMRQPRDQGISIERAQKLGAKPFEGKGDPEAAFLWLEAAEEAYQVMGCTDEQRVTFSGFLMRGEAKAWWRALQGRQPAGVSWADFRREFLETFYPKSYTEA